MAIQATSSTPTATDSHRTSVMTRAVRPRLSATAATLAARCTNMSMKDLALYFSSCDVGV